MGLRALGVMFGFVLAYGQATAAVIDQFDCTVQLIDHRGEPGQEARATVTGIRTVQAPDPDWIEGVTATTGSVKLRLEDSSTEAGGELRISYTHYYSPISGQAAQSTCLASEVWTRDEGAAESCSFGVDLPPYDPTNFYPRTSLTPNGRARFRAQDLASITSSLPSHPRWRSFRAECRHLGTFE